MKESEELQRLKTEKQKNLESLKTEPKVKIKALRPIRPDSLGGVRVLRVGEIAEVAASEAKEFCEKSFNGYSDESGLKSTKYSQVKIFRAEYVQEKSKMGNRVG